MTALRERNGTMPRKRHFEPVSEAMLLHSLQVGEPTEDEYEERDRHAAKLFETIDKMRADGRLRTDPLTGKVRYHAPAEDPPK